MRTVSQPCRRVPYTTFRHRSGRTCGGVSIPAHEKRTLMNFERARKHSLIARLMPARAGTNIDHAARRKYNDGMACSLRASARSLQDGPVVAKPAIANIQRYIYMYIYTRVLAPMQSQRNTGRRRRAFIHSPISRDADATPIFRMTIVTRGRAFPRRVPHGSTSCLGGTVN